MSLTDLSDLTLSSTAKASRAFKKASSFDPGLERVDTNVVSGGAYNVAVQKTPKTNALLEFAGGLNKGVKLYGSATELAQKQSQKNVAEMTDEEFEESYNELIQGSGQEAGFFDKVLGRDKQFQTSMVDRWFRDVAPTEVNELRKGLESEMENFKTTVDFDNYVEKNVDDYFAAKSVQFADGTHANTAYAVRSAGMAAKLKVTLDQKYSDAADKAIEDNQLIVTKQLLEDRVFSSGTAEENNEVFTTRFNDLVSAFGGDKTRAKAVMKSAVSGLITDLTTKGTIVDLEEAQEIYDSFFNSELEIDGKKDVFDDPKMEQSLLAGMQRAEELASKADEKAAEKAAINTTSLLYRSMADGKLEETIQETVEKANAQLDAGEISPREHAVIIAKTEDFRDKETAAFNARRNEKETNVNIIKGRAHFSDFDWFNSQVLNTETNQDLLDRGLARYDSVRGEVELTNEYISLQNQYEKTFLRVANNLANEIDWLTLDSDQQAIERQRILEAAKEAGKAFVNKKTVEIEEKETQQGKVPVMRQDAIDNKGLTPQEADQIVFEHSGDIEKMTEVFEALPLSRPPDVSRIFDEDGNFDKTRIAPFESIFGTRVSLARAIRKEFKERKINPEQFDNAVTYALQLRQYYVPASITKVKHAQDTTLDLLMLSGVTSDEIINNRLTHLGNPESKAYPDPIHTRETQKTLNATADIRGLRQRRLEKEKKVVKIGYDIPILLDGSMRKTIDAIKTGNVAAFEKMAEALGAEATAETLYNLSVRYHQKVTGEIDEDFDHRKLKKPNPSPVEETEQ